MGLIPIARLSGSSVPLRTTDQRPSLPQRPQPDSPARHALGDPGLDDLVELAGYLITDQTAAELGTEALDVRSWTIRPAEPEESGLR